MAGLMSSSYFWVIFLSSRARKRHINLLLHKPNSCTLQLYEINLLDSVLSVPETAPTTVHIWKREKTESRNKVDHPWEREAGRHSRASHLLNGSDSVAVCLYCSWWILRKKMWGVCEGDDVSHSPRGYGSNGFNRCPEFLPKGKIIRCCRVKILEAIYKSSCLFDGC